MEAAKPPWTRSWLRVTTSRVDGGPPGAGDAEEEGGAAAAGQGQGGGGAGGVVGRLDHGVEVAGQAGQGVRVACGHDPGGATARAEGGAGRAAAHEDELGRAGGRQEQEGEQAEGPVADHRDPGAGQRHAGLEQAAGHAGGRLEQGRRGQRAVGRQAVDEAGGDGQALGQGAGVGEAGLGVPGRAKVGPSLGAAVADAAGAQPLGHHRVARGEVAHPGAERLDPPGPFVSRHHRVADVGGRPAAVEQLEVGAADPGGLHRDQHLPGARDRLRHVGDGRPPRPGDDQCEHERLLAWGRSRVAGRVGPEPLGPGGAVLGDDQVGELVQRCLGGRLVERDRAVLQEVDPVADLEDLARSCGR